MRRKAWFIIASALLPNVAAASQCPSSPEYPWWYETFIYSPALPMYFVILAIFLVATIKRWRGRKSPSSALRPKEGLLLGLATFQVLNLYMWYGQPSGCSFTGGAVMPLAVLTGVVFLPSLAYYYASVFSSLRQQREKAPTTKAGAGRAKEENLMNPTATIVAGLILGAVLLVVALVISRYAAMYAPMSEGGDSNPMLGDSFYDEIYEQGLPSYR